MIALVLKILSWFSDLLPNDPFQQNIQEFCDSVVDYIAVLNYFVPFYLYIPIISVWGIAMSGVWLYKNGVNFFGWLVDMIEFVLKFFGKK